MITRRASAVHEMNPVASSAAAADRALGEVVDAAPGADLEAFHYLGRRRDAAPQIIAAVRGQRGLTVVPRALIAEVPRVPWRAIDRGTRQEYPHSVQVRSHSRAKNPRGTLALFARPQPALNGGAPPGPRPRR